MDYLLNGRQEATMTTLSPSQANQLESAIILTFFHTVGTSTVIQYHSCDQTQSCTLFLDFYEALFGIVVTAEQDALFCRPAPEAAEQIKYSSIGSPRFCDDLIWIVWCSL